MPDMFQRRVAFQPFEYPELEGFKEAIQNSYWTVREWNFVGDIQDFANKLGPVERGAVKNTLLAISQVEVSVKRFWVELGKRFPKAEFEQVGVTFGESEVRHADAYSRLLKVLHLNADFEGVLQVPAIAKRVAYLAKFMAGAGATSNKGYAMVLTLFSAFVENVSLFSQFAIIKAMNKHGGILKDIDNVISATQKEETIHALLGQWIINQMRRENPDWFDARFYKDLEDAAVTAWFAECEIIDWIFEAGELPYLSKAALKEFIKQRLNESVVAIGGTAFLGPLDPALLGQLDFFNQELHAQVAVDFFHKRPVEYTRGDKPITSEDLF